MENIIKIVKSFEKSRFLLKGVTETVQNEVKEQKAEFLSVLLGIRYIRFKFIRKSFNWKGVYRAGKGKGINRADEGIVRVGYGRPSSSASHDNNEMDF